MGVVATESRQSCALTCIMCIAFRRRLKIPELGDITSFLFDNCECNGSDSGVLGRYMVADKKIESPIKRMLITNKGAACNKKMCLVINMTIILTFIGSFSCHPTRPMSDDTNIGALISP
jgi:hypothetical protein